MDLVTILGYAAVTFIVTRAGIFRWLREIGPKGWRDFVSCQLCAGWWIGAGLHAASNANALIHSRYWSVGLEVVLTGALTGAVALLYTAILDALPMPPEKND